MDAVEKFYKLSEEFCRYLSETEISNDSASSLIKLLMELYLSAFDLPDAEPETIAPSYSSSMNPLTIRTSEHFSHLYWEIYDPFVCEKPVCASLLDDLSDIAADLKKGMAEYDLGKTGNAIFEWKLGFDSHWGNHLVDALRALHMIRTTDTPKNTT